MEDVRILPEKTLKFWIRDIEDDLKDTNFRIAKITIKGDERICEIERRPPAGRKWSPIN